MPDLIYDHGLDEWRDWETDDVVFLVTTDAYSPLRTHQFVADVVASEITSDGYARWTATGKTRTVNTSAHQIEYDCDSPTFGVLSATSPSAQDVGGVVVAKVVTDDSDSILLGFLEVVDFPADDSEFAPIVPSTGVHVTRQA